MQQRRQLSAIVFAALVNAGCGSYGVVVNQPLASGKLPEEAYSLVQLERAKKNSDDIALLLAFSGGGTRAAALAFGVLLELRASGFPAGGSEARLLDEIDAISSVSGGSFTAAYYGLHGEGLFASFEEVFLRRDFQGPLITGLFGPGQWFNSTGRTEMAVKLFDERVFMGATFADLRAADGPLILINTSDLEIGARFTFVQEYFDLLCSDLSNYPISRAVTASSAVPILFNPVVVKNYQDCKGQWPDWLVAARERSRDAPRLADFVAELESFYREKDRYYIHFVDGGVTDNLGLRAIYEIIELSGGAVKTLEKAELAPPSKLVVLSVDAATNPPNAIGATNRQPSPVDVGFAIGSIQLHRYNDATATLLTEAVEAWAAEASTGEHPIDPYFIRLGFNDLEDPADRRYFNAVPTSFNLSDEQIDRLIQAGRELLRRNPEFQRLLAELGT